MIARTVAMVLLAAITASAAGPGEKDLKAVIRAVEGRYEKARTLKATFLERYSEGRRAVRVESGTVYFSRPGRTRWEYISVLSKQVEEQKRSRRQARSNSAEDELNRQIRKRDEIQRKISEFARKSQMSSLVQSEYSKLAQDYDNASKQYNETLAKLTDAKVAKEIEDTQLGERFLIIEEPRVPFKPEKPNRLKIMLTGLLLSLFAGLFASIVMENLDHSIKSPDQLKKITKVPFLTVLPFVMTDEERKARAGKSFISKVIHDMKR